MAKRNLFIHPDAPIPQPDHPRPRTRRELIAQGFQAGAGAVFGGSIFSLFAKPHEAKAALADDIESLIGTGANQCNVRTVGGKIPFICFDLAGGANFAGSNVLIGRSGGQMDFLTTAGYGRQGLPGDMVPSLGDQFLDTDLGLAFHFDSAFLKGIKTIADPTTLSRVNGCVIAARSENDTGNNPHNPMYGIARTGANGELATLIGSRNSDSGGNSMAPMAMINAEARPVKVDRPSDVTGLVDVGDLVGVLTQQQTVNVMEAIYRLSDAKLGKVQTEITADAVVKQMVRCGYIKSADLADRFANPADLNPIVDPLIVGGDSGGQTFTPIFTADQLDNREFAKTASVMKMVIEGLAGAGCITMGGYDYHGQGRITGETRDFRAGLCMGACLEYAARVGQPLMMYVFSDGSLSANNATEAVNNIDVNGFTLNAEEKFMWQSDNQQTAASFFLIYDPNATNNRPTRFSDDQPEPVQIGHMRPEGNVETLSHPGANNVNLLVELICLNYMALHGEQANFNGLFGNGLGTGSALDQYIAFNPIV